MRRIFKRRAPVQSAIGPKKHLNFPEAVAYWMKKDGSMGLRLYRRKKTGLGFEFVSEMPLRDGAAMSAHVEQSLRDSHGGGAYQFRIVDSKTNEVGQYDFRIAGASKDGDGEKTERKPSKMEELYMTFMTTIMTKAVETGFGGGAQQMGIADIISIVDKLKGDDISKEFLVTMANNFITNKENHLSNLRELAEAAKLFMPEVRQEEPLTALVSGLAPVVGQLMMAKSMQGNQPAQQQQTAGGMEALPGPGEPAPGASEPGAGEHHRADGYIQVLRGRIVAGAEPAELADIIITLTQTDARLSVGDPHPALRHLAAERDPAKLPEAFNSFCRAIPELDSNPELARRVGLALMARLMQFSAQAEPAEQPSAEPSEEGPAASADEPIAEITERRSRYAAREPAAEIDAAPPEQEVAPDDTDNTVSTEPEGHDAAETDAPGGDGETVESGSTGEVAGR